MNKERLIEQLKKMKEDAEEKYQWAKRTGGRDSYSISTMASYHGEVLGLVKAIETIKREE